MSCTLFLCQEAKWTDINQPIVQSYAILLDWQIPTSHITHPHWSQVFTLSLLSRPRFSFSVQSVGAEWRLGMGVRRGLVSPRLFWGRVSRCLWGEAARLLLSSVLCSVQCLVTAPLSLTGDYCGPNTCNPGSRTEILHTGQADFLLSVPKYFPQNHSEIHK